MEADLFAAWLLSGRVEGAPVEAKIAVMIPETTLTGHSDDPGISADRNWVIPANDARHLAGDPRTCHDWYHATTSPPQPGPIQPGAGDVSPDILAITYTGRYAPARLRDAIIFRDGVCQAPGCTIPAQRCDLDHRLPYPTGPTSGPNLQALCRRHHRLKSHGLLTLPEPEQAAPDTTAPPPPRAPAPPPSQGPPPSQRSTSSLPYPGLRSRRLPPTRPPGRGRHVLAPQRHTDLIAARHTTPGSGATVAILYDADRRHH
ncbi:HNH endonuclease signature motif containing protein [Nesterenkonia aethiopica]|uniref:HNH endonuclease signature motif containing protein n=1 Tax=Nesterenkonia aethiopica TaxID=269144 RepID=UPI0031D2DDCA